MAVITATKTDIGGGAFMYVWTPIVAGDTCSALDVTVLNGCGPDRTVQVTDTFGDGGSIAIQGACNTASPVYATLTSAANAALLITTTTPESIVQWTPLLKPLLVGSDGTTSLTVTIVARAVK